VIGYELRMAIPRESARTLTTVSAVVVAVCVVVLTARVMVFGLPLVVEQQKIYDNKDLAERVFQALDDKDTLGGGFGAVTCPTGVTIKSGVTFRCTVEHNGQDTSVQVTVTDTDSGDFEVGNPEK
jgi:hypothetical protein